MVEKELEIPPMPDDFMPSQRSTQGKKIQFNDAYHKVTRDEMRRQYWDRKWKIHYLQQRLRNSEGVSK